MEVAGAGFEIAPAALLRFGSRLLLKGLQIGQIGLAEGAAHRLQVESNILLQIEVEDLQQVTAQLFAGRTAESLASPNRPDGVLAAIPLLHDGPKLPAQRL